MFLETKIDDISVSLNEYISFISINMYTESTSILQ